MFTNLSFSSLANDRLIKRAMGNIVYIKVVLVATGERIVIAIKKSDRSKSISLSGSDCFLLAAITYIKTPINSAYTAATKKVKYVSLSFIREMSESAEKNLDIIAIKDWFLCCRYSDGNVILSALIQFIISPILRLIPNLKAGINRRTANVAMNEKTALNLFLTSK
jgi:hypothetical protein